MSSDKKPFATENATNGVLVRGPRVTDGVGKALRSAYRGNGALPGDWQSRLDLLEGRC